MNNDNINIPLIENYNDYPAPCFIKDSINRLLSGIPQKYLIGIKSIILTNSKSLTSDRKKDDKNKLKNGWQTLAFYNPQRKSKPAFITMYIDRIIKDFPPLALKFHIIIDVIIGHVLFHEIGHHIHYSKIPEYRDREKVADKWIGKLGRKYLWRRYWYFMLFLSPIITAYKRLKKKTN